MDGVEHLANGQRCGGVLANQAKALLVFGRRAVFQPEQVVRLHGLAQTPRFDRRQAMVHVVEDMQVVAKTFAHGGE
ncbi:hypothetical protein D3C75_1347500 [compost metagenome]